MTFPAVGALARMPGRAQASLRTVIACLLTVALSMTLQIPNVALSASMVLFVSRRDVSATNTAAIALVAAASAGIGLTLLADLFTVELAPLRLAAMALLFCAGMYLSRVFVAGQLGFGLGFSLLITQATVDLFPSPEALVRGTLWTWVAIAIASMAVITVNLAQAAGRWRGTVADGGAGLHVAAATVQPARARCLFVADALTNPEYTWFALKTTAAAMLCYVIYTALAWPGIHTCVITCAVVAQASREQSIHKARLRIAGALVGGALALLATVFVVPHLESLGGLLLMVAPVAAASAWIAAGHERHAYFGLQIAFAFFLCVLHGYGPSTDVTVVRDRWVGIVLGIAVMSVVFPPDRRQK